MITSTSNPKIKHVAELVKSARTRREEGLFVAEGVRLCMEVPADRVLEAYVSECYAKSVEGNESTESSYDFIARNIPYETVSDAAFKKMSDTVSSQGVLCVVKCSDTKIDGFMADHESGALRLLILENIQDPGNLGTMIRTAEAAGFDAVITDRNTVDVYNPKVIRSTMGCIFRVPVIATDDLREALDKMRNEKVRLFATLLDESIDYSEVSYGDRLGIIIGNEGSGLTKETADMADVHVHIPMCGQVESLNASVAAALMMYAAR